MESLAAFCVRTGRTELLLQWDAGKNLPLTPEAVSSGSGRNVWWRCGRGHRWQARVKSRTEGCGCPVCAGRAVAPGENDLATVDPALAKEWHPTKNGSLTPEDLTAGSHRKVWWRCGRGHEWQSAVFARRAGGGCPVCAGGAKRRAGSRAGAENMPDPGKISS